VARSGARRERRPPCRQGGSAGLLRLESFDIELHDVIANDAHAVALVRYDHRRDGRSFRQLGAEVFHFDGAGRISAFWVLIDDTTAFDEFFA
jgi:hypothetical protein